MDDRECALGHSSIHLGGRVCDILESLQIAWGRLRNFCAILRQKIVPLTPALIAVIDKCAKALDTPRCQPGFFAQLPHSAVLRHFTSIKEACREAQAHSPRTVLVLPDQLHPTIRKHGHHKTEIAQPDLVKVLNPRAISGQHGLFDDLQVRRTRANLALLQNGPRPMDRRRPLRQRLACAQEIPPR